MSNPPPSVSQQTVPAPTNPVGVVAVVDQSRDLVTEKATERAQDRAEASKAKPRFEARKVTSLSRPIPAQPEYETLIFKAASNNPLAYLANYTTSTWIPNTAVAYYILSQMDIAMASTKRWIDNCMGWVPPISQMYIGILMYVQIVRAMDAANILTPGSPLSNFYQTFLNVFPLSELWIPGPLVAFFRNISAFWPSADDQFGNVAPTLPATPGWTQANFYNLAVYNVNGTPAALLPNISYFISRLRSITTVATGVNVNQGVFSSHINGPNHANTIYGVALNNGAAQQTTVRTPGAAFAYPDFLPLWQNAAQHLTRLAIPDDLVGGGANPTAPIDEWTAFFRFSQVQNEHVWFGPVSAVMAKYCQFFYGSQNLESVAPNCSAAGAIKLRIAPASTLYALPQWNAQQGNGNSNEHGNANAAAHYTLRTNARFISNARLALKDVPDAHYLAAITYGINAYDAQANQNACRQGPFWSLGPDTYGRDNIEVLPGILSTVIREYHSDLRLTASKQ